MPRLFFTTFSARCTWLVSASTGIVSSRHIGLAFEAKIWPESLFEIGVLVSYLTRQILADNFLIRFSTYSGDISIFLKTFHPYSLARMLLQSVSGDSVSVKSGYTSGPVHFCSVLDNLIMQSASWIARFSVVLILACNVILSGDVSAWSSIPSECL